MMMIIIIIIMIVSLPFSRRQTIRASMYFVTLVWPRDLDTRPWPKYSQDVPSYQNDVCRPRHTLPAHALQHRRIWALHLIFKGPGCLHLERLFSQDLLFSRYGRAKSPLIWGTSRNVTFSLPLCNLGSLDINIWQLSRSNGGVAPTVTSNDLDLLFVVTLTHIKGNSRNQDLPAGQSARPHRSL